MFGRGLEETMEVETRLGGGYIPILLHRCVSFIRQQSASPLHSLCCHLSLCVCAGLQEVGVFRLPGQTRRVQDLKELYDQGQSRLQGLEACQTHRVWSTVQVASRTSWP